jgi:hypothetical protein
MTELRQLRGYRYEIVAALIGVIFLALAYFEGLRVRRPTAEPHVDAMPHSVAVGPATARATPKVGVPHPLHSGEPRAD